MAYFDFEPEDRLHSTWTPIIDVFERSGEIFIRAELPGVDKGDVRLRWKDNVLEISGFKRPEPSEHESCRYLCVERPHGRFRREVAIRAAIDFERSTAELRNGLLLVRLPTLTQRPGDSCIPID